MTGAREEREPQPWGASEAETGPSSLPRRSRGPSAIAEAAAALGTEDPGSGTGSEPRMSAAAAEFAAATAADEPFPAAPPTGDARAPGPGFGGRGADDAPAAPAPAPAPASGPAAPEPGASRRRPSRKAVLIGGAAVVGALALTVPFLVGGGDGGSRSGAAADGSDTVVGDPGSAAGSGMFDPDQPAGNSATLRTDATQSGGGSAKPSKATDGSPTPAGPTAGTPAATGAAGNDDKSDAKGSTGNSSATVPGVLVRGHGSGRCIDAADGADHTRLRIWDCTGAARQKWRFASDGTVRALGKCMDVDGGSRDDGAIIKVVGCNGTGAQQFRLNAAHDLVNVQADKCVDVKDMGTANGVELQLWSCGGTDNQKWSTA